MTLEQFVESYDYNFYGGALNVTSFSDYLKDTDSNGLNDTLVINITTNASSSEKFYFIVSLIEGRTVILNWSNVTVNSSSPSAQVTFSTKSFGRSQYNYTTEIRNQSQALVYEDYKTQTALYTNYERGNSITSISSQNVANNTLRISVTVNVTQNRTENITVWATGGNITINGTAQVTLVSPSTVAQIDIDNESIKRTHWVGVFNVTLVRLGDRTFQTNHTTSSYSYEHFAKTSYVKNTTISTTDADSDGLFDTLRFNVTVIGKEATVHNLTGGISDGNGNLIASVNTTKTLSVGTNTALLEIQGTDLYSTYADGPFSLSFVTLTRGNQTIDSVAGLAETNYSYSDFEPPARPDLTVIVNVTRNTTTSNVTVTARNIGAATAFNVVLDVFDNGTYENQSSIPQLDASANGSVSFLVPNEPFNQFIAIVDLENTVDESNESNNMGSTIVASMNVTFTDLSPNTSNKTFRTTIFNNGTQDLFNLTVTTLFGDGASTSSNVSLGLNQSTNVSAQHVYANGSYNATVVVANDVISVNKTVSFTVTNGSGGGGGSSQPRLTVSLVTPSSSTNVTRNAFFPFTMQVCCLDANCSQVDVSLDPERTEYTYTSEKHCVGDECTTSLYSVPRFGLEEGQWKPLEELHTFRGTTPIVCDVQSDGQHLVECTEYNSTHRTVRVSLRDGGFLRDVPIRILTPTVTSNGVTWSERTRISTRLATPWSTAEVIVPIAYAEELHVGETSTNVSYLPNASAVEGYWEATGGSLAMYGWADCNANAYSAGDKSAISVNTTAASIYGEGGGSATDYTYCHRIRWNVTEEPNNISRIWAYSRWTGSLSSGADSITKALYLGNVTGQSWKALNVRTNAWGEEQHEGEVTSGIADFVNDTASGNYIYTLLHMNASKAGSTKAYSNYYYAEIRITSGSGGGSATKSGLVSNTTGTTPFYTNSSNPVAITLNQNQCQNVTWYVNATGNLSTTHVFFAYANKTSNTSINNRTTSINITISNASSSAGWSVTDTDTFASNDESWTGGTRDATATTYNSSGDWGTLRKNYTLSISADVVNLTINDFWYNDDTNDPKIFVPGSTASDNDYLLFDGTKPNINWKHVDDNAGYGECNQDISGTVTWADGDSISVLVNYTSGQWCTYHNGQKCRCEVSTLAHGDNFEINVGNTHVVAIDNVVYSELD